jgi:predicted nuclease of predicted toxin-antitoxin system
VRWLADECVDAGLVSHLHAAGHDVIYMAEVSPAASDAQVLIRAQADRRILLTEDKDFGDLVFRRGQSVPGIILLRIDPAKHVLKKARLDEAVDRFGDDLFGRYVTVEGARFRSRPLPRLNESNSD